MDKKYLLKLARDLSNTSSSTALAMAESLLKSTKSLDDEKRKDEFFKRLILLNKDENMIGGKDSNKSLKEKFNKIIEFFEISEKCNKVEYSNKYASLNFVELEYILGWSRRLAKREGISVAYNENIKAVDTKENFPKNKKTSSFNKPNTGEKELFNNPMHDKLKGFFK